METLEKLISPLLSMLRIMLLVTVFDMAAYAQNEGRTDTFKLDYKINLNGRIKRENYWVYVGMLNPARQIGNNTYKRLVFGDTLGRVLAVVRQTDDGLYYIPLVRQTEEGLFNIPDSALDAKDEKPLLLFNKRVNKKWKVNIGDGEFWQKEITFTGILHTEDDDLYVYNLKVSKGNYDIAREKVSKIYFSRKNGFVKLRMQTHWLPPVDVERSK